MKETIIEVMNRHGYSLTEEAKLIDLVLLIEHHRMIRDELVAKGLFVKTKKAARQLQHA